MGEKSITREVQWYTICLILPEPSKVMERGSGSGGLVGGEFVDSIGAAIGLIADDLGEFFFVRFFEGFREVAGLRFEVERDEGDFEFEAGDFAVEVRVVGLDFRLLDRFFVRFAALGIGVSCVRWFVVHGRIVLDLASDCERKGGQKGARGSLVC